MIVIIIAIVVLILDQLSKVWVVNTLKTVRDIPIIDGVLHWHYAENTGSAFSMMNGVKWYPIFVAIIAVIVSILAIIYVFTRKYKMHWLEILSIGLVIGGAIGNQIDRLRFGYVIDFIYFKLINFAIFNIADSALVVGAFLLAYYILFVHDKHTAKFKTDVEAEEKTEDIKQIEDAKADS
ncbi:MAG: signal peptidase II [Eubacteriales bacterium]